MGFNYPSPTASPTTKSAPALVFSSSGKKWDQTGTSSRKKYVKQVTGRHNDTELHLASQRGDLPAARAILAEIDSQMTGTGSDFDKEVEEIRYEMVNEVNDVGQTALSIAAEKGHLDMVVELLRYTDRDGLARKNHSGFDALHVAAREGHHGNKKDNFDCLIH